MKPFDKINPAIKATPLVILLAMIVPQLLLVLFRTHSLSIVKGMITEHHILIHANYIGIPLGLAGFALWMVFGSRQRGGDLPRWNAFWACKNPKHAVQCIHHGAERVSYPHVARPSET